MIFEEFRKKFVVKFTFIKFYDFDFVEVNVGFNGDFDGIVGNFFVSEVYRYNISFGINGFIFYTEGFVFLVSGFYRNVTIIFVSEGNVDIFWFSRCVIYNEVSFDYGFDFFFYFWFIDFDIGWFIGFFNLYLLEEINLFF